MIYCAGYTVSFQEVPDEVSLVLLISNCPYHCPGCHSPELQTVTGEVLTKAFIDNLIAQYYDAITCVCFMGEGNDIPTVVKFAKYIHSVGLKTALYTGMHDIDCFSIWFDLIDGNIDYLKCGQYIEELGGLDSRNTNQRMYKLEHTDNSFEMKNITAKFWKNYGDENYER